MRQPMSLDEPPAAWGGRQSPEFNTHPQTDSEHKSNLVKYITGYPWVLIAADRGGESRYFCGKCSRAATVQHLRTLRRPHRTDHKQVRQGIATVPTGLEAWMGRFRSIPTTGEEEHLFTYDGYDIWPDYCIECNRATSPTRICQDATYAESKNRKHSTQATQTGAKAVATTTTAASDHALTRTRPPVRERERGQPTFPPPAQATRTTADTCKNQTVTRGSSTESNTKDEEGNSAKGRVITYRPHGGKAKDDNAKDPQRAAIATRCHGELRMRASYARDLDKYMKCHNRLFTMDRYSPCGPWPAELKFWSAFKASLRKFTQGTIALDATIVRNGRGQADHHSCPPAKLWHAPERRGKNSHQPQPPGSRQHHLRHRRKHQARFFHHGVEVAVGTLRDVRVRQPPHGQALHLWALPDRHKH